MTREPPEIPNVTPIRKNSTGYPIDAQAADVLASSLAAIQHAKQANATTSGLTPYGYLMEVLRDTDADPYLRVMAAEALMPYCHKKE
jgi:hypothetical protein